MKLPILIAADGAAWEANLVLELERVDHGVSVVRRCVDIIDLLAVAASGQARAALVSSSLRHLDADAVDRLTAASVVPVGVVGRGDGDAEDRLRAIGIVYLVPEDADPKVIAAVIDEAVAAGTDPGGGARSIRAFGDPTGAISMLVAANSPPDPAAVRHGSVLAVWGPTGAPGRTTVAVTLADELSRLGRETLLIDADVYGGVIASTLGLLDESPGIAAACRQASTSRLKPDELAALCWQLTPRLRVLTGIPRAERWPELRSTGVEAVVSVARAVADFVVVDCGFCLETDEELSFDRLAPRRNGATLAVLDAADLVLAIGSADSLGLQRLVRGLDQLRDAEIAAPSWVVLNRVRRAVAPRDPTLELTEALQRFAGRSPAALLPLDQEAVDAAAAVGKTLAEVRPSSPLRHAAVELAAGIAGVPSPLRRGRRRRERVSAA